MADSNPFYFGYYPGDRGLFKNYGARNVPNINLPGNIGVGGSLEQIQATLDAAVNSLDAPNWLKERIVADFNKSLAVIVSQTPKLDVAEAQMRGSEAIEDMPGVAVSMNLDPRQWAKDPAGMAKKTAKSWLSGTLDWNDFDRKSRAIVWADMLSDDPAEAKHWLEERSRRTAIRAVEERSIRAAGTVRPTGPNPLSLSSDADYRDTKGAIISFQFNSTNEKGRENSFDAVIKESSKSMSADLQSRVYEYKKSLLSPDQLQEIDMRNAVTRHFRDTKFENELRDMMARGVPEWQIQNRIDEVSRIAVASMPGVDRNVIRDHADRMVHTIRTRPDVDDALTHVADAFTIPSLDSFRAAAWDKKNLKFSDDFRKDFEAYVKNIPGLNPTQANAYIQQAELFFVQNEVISHLDVVSNSIDNAVKALDKAAVTTSSKNLLAAQSSLTSLQGTLKEYSPQRMEALLAKLPADKAERYRKHMKGYLGGTLHPSADASLHKILSEVDISKITDISSAGASISLRRLSSRFNDVKSGGLVGQALTGGDIPFVGLSAQRKILRDIGDEWFHYGHQAQALNHLTARGHVIFTLFPRLEDERSENEWREVFRLAEKGDLLNIYAWNRIKNKYKYFTPSYWVQRGLEDVNYFGLNIKQAYGVTRSVGGTNVTTNYAFRVGGAHFLKLGDTQNGASGGLKGALFRNNFKVEFDPGLGIGSARLYGGDHFKFVKSFDIKLEELFRNNTLNIDQFKLLFGARNEADFFRYLQAAGFKFSDKEAQDLFRQFTNFRTWVNKNGHLFGVDARTLNSPEFLYGLFNAVHREDRKFIHWGVDNINGIAQAYAGPLQKVFKYLNAIQTKIYDSTVGRYLATVSNYKTFIVEKLTRGALKKAIENLVSKLVIVVGGTVTEGVGAIIVKLIEPVVRYVVRKFLDAGEAVLKATLKGDFSGIFSGFNHAVEASIKALLYASAIPVAMVLVVMFVVVNMLGGFSPVNPSVAGGGEYIGPTAGGAPGGSALSCNQDTISPTNCFFRDGHRIFQYSYNSAGEVSSGGPYSGGYGGGTGHGSNYYWFEIVQRNMGVGPCAFVIPGSSSGNPASGSTTATNVCYNVGATPRSYYGFALDAAPTEGSCGTVYLPNIADTWNVGSPGSSSFGAVVVLTGLVGGQERYKMALIHLGPGSIRSGTTLQPGDEVAELYDWGSNTHIHVELAERSGSGWTPIRPESVLCN